MSNLKPFADLKYKARTYTDESGKEKGVWVQVGTLFSSPHGSHMVIKIDTIPVGEWNGWLNVYRREEAEEDYKVTDKDIKDVEDGKHLDDINF